MSGKALFGGFVSFSVIFIEEETPELLGRRKAFEGLDIFQKIMSGGI